MNLKDWKNKSKTGNPHYSFAFIDEGAKREVRRKILKAIAIPGYQVPFGSRDMPLARGWGTGGIQVTLALIGPDEILKVIDQGADDSVNAVNIKKFVSKVTGAKLTEDTLEATLVQSRHRIPEERMREGQILVLQVPIPEALRDVEASERETRRMHAEADYSAMWLYLYENIVRFKEITIGSRYPVMVNHRYIMDPSPIPRWDNPKLHMSANLYLFGAGREKRIYAIPPYTSVVCLEFEDYRFRVEDFGGAVCQRCGSAAAFLDEMIDDSSGRRRFVCSDTSFCTKQANLNANRKHPPRAAGLGD